MDTKFYLKGQNQKIAGIPPCISCFLGARILGRVWIPAFSKKQSLKKWWAFRPVFHVFGARNLGRVPRSGHAHAQHRDIDEIEGTRITKTTSQAEYKSPLGLLLHWLVSLLVYIFLDPGTVAGFAKQLDIYIYICIL